MKKVTTFVVFLLVAVFLLSPWLMIKSNAAELSKTFLFLARMKTATSTDMILLVTPSASFSTASTLKIFFPDAEDMAWCKTNDTVLTVAGVTTSPIDLGAWDIDTALPGILVGKCLQGSTGSGDYIQVTGLTALTAATNYGLSISSHAQFTTGTTTGNNLISVSLVNGTQVETLSFGLNLLANDQVVVSATVATANTISCTLSTNTVNLGSLYKGGAYITGTHTFSTNSTSGYYWAVYGVGNGTTAAGLYKSAATTYLISSAGTGGLVNLITGTEGFGLALTTSVGTVSTNYVATTPGVFGAIGRTFSNANLILSNTSSSGGAQSTTAILGAKAGSAAEAGSYQETLTYICGAYVGS